VGPETYTFRDFVALLADGIGSGARVVHVPPALGIALGRAIGFAVRDVVLTTDELRGLMDSLLTSDQAPNGSTLFSHWVESNKDRIGTAYTSELGRHFKWRRVA